MPSSLVCMLARPRVLSEQLDSGPVIPSSCRWRSLQLLFNIKMCGARSDRMTNGINTYGNDESFIGRAKEPGCAAKWKRERPVGEREFGGVGVRVVGASGCLSVLMLIELLSGGVNLLWV